MKATIIGAGIGGLTVAIALKRKGVDVELFEATTAFKRVGAGIVLALNAMQIFDRLGMVNALEQAGNILEGMEITNAKLKALGITEHQYFESIYKLRNIAIHRASLHEVLLKELGEDVPLHLNKKLKSLKQKDGMNYLEFEDGTKYETPLLIGADGIHSAVRRAVFPDTKERLAKQWCWRGVVDFELEPAYKQVAREAVGRGVRFGIVPISQGKVYWYACASYKKNAQKEFSNIAIEHIFKDFSPVVQQIIKATDSAKIISAELSDLEQLDQWYKNTMVLMGDAAHATTPNMGQGANQAIESAWVLSECLTTEQDLCKAFEKYQQIRQAKANDVVKTSWQVGQIMHVSNPVAAKLRDWMFLITPSWVGRMQLKKLFELGY